MPRPPSGATAAAIEAQVARLEQSQWWPVELLRDRQLTQLQLLLRYAYRHSAFYRERLEAAAALPDGDLDEDAFRAIPLLRRSELLTQEATINSDEVPPSHGPLSVTQTSGSTGEIVKVRRTAVNQLMWWALVMRDHAWHRRDFSLPFVAIRANASVLDDETKAAEVGWGAPVSWFHATGPGYARPIATDVAELAGWLCRRDPGYLLTYPTYLAALLTYFERHGLTLQRLREVRTIGETLQPEVRARCRAVLGVPVVDSYSSQEVGAIALQCPDSGSYHVHAESLIVEVLDADGRACAPGQIGRVVVTDLHNFATPLIRYELRDHAEVGPICPCGRGLPTLARILGRQRNMVALPDGRRHWPLLGFTRYREIAPVLQYQVVQHTLEDVEMRLVTAGGALDVEQERRLTEVLCEALGHPFRVRITYFEGELPRSRSAKFEEFLSFVE